MFCQSVSGMPLDCIKKRMHRIFEALRMESGTFENQLKHVIYTLPDGGEAYFLKPGKEAKRNSRNNPNDMLPFVDGMQKKYSFSDVWNILCKLRNTISLDNYKKLSVILYRLAYLLDCNDENGIVRFAPNDYILSEIYEIQKEVNSNGLDTDIMSLIYFIDLLGWNEDVKYQHLSVLSESGYDENYKKLKKPVGRINTILTCISLPISFQNFTDNVIKNAANPSEIDFELGTKIAQKLINGMGIYTLNKSELIEFLSPYLTY